MDKMITLNVGGTKFATKTTTLQKYPETRLGKLTSSSPEFIAEKQYYFFDRNPDMFNIILDFYRNDEVHLSTNFCSRLVQKELEYWKIPCRDISECCRSTFVKEDNDLEINRKLKPIVDTYKSIQSSATCNERFKRQIWLFLEEPMSSRPAKLYNVVYCIMVVVSVLMALLFTNPDMRLPLTDKNMTNNITLTSDHVPLSSTLYNNQKAVLIATTRMPFWWHLIDDSLLAFFTLEFIIRFFAFPSKVDFFRSWINILDIILNISMWTRFIFRENRAIVMKYEAVTIINQLCFCFVSLRMFRLTRLAKQFDGFRILLISLKESCKELFLLLVTFFMVAAFFANLIYFAEFKEPSTFQSSLTGLWWSVVTMTTVGYGDHYPKSVYGQIVGSFCAVCGLIIVAMPIAIIASNLNDLYHKMKDIQKFKSRVEKDEKPRHFKRKTCIAPEKT